MIRILITNLAALITDDKVSIPKTQTDRNTITDGLQVFLGIAAAVAILIIAISALRLIISRGNPDTLNRSRETIIYAVVGLVICAAAFAIVTFVVEQV